VDIEQFGLVAGLFRPEAERLVENRLNGGQVWCPSCPQTKQFLQHGRRGPRSILWAPLKRQKRGSSLRSAAIARDTSADSSSTEGSSLRCKFLFKLPAAQREARYPLSRSHAIIVRRLYSVAFTEAFIELDTNLFLRTAASPTSFTENGGQSMVSRQIVYSHGEVASHGANM
jgi:hypothetical protein